MKASEIKRGNVVEHDGRVWQVRGIERSSPQGRGGNVTFRFTLYSVPGGQKLDLSLRAEDDLKETELTRRAVTFSYRDDTSYVFMDNENFSQYTLGSEAVGDAAGYISDGLDNCYVQLIDDVPVGLQLPATVTLEVAETAPELKGASATKRAKPATLESGLEIQVPEYITSGEKILVNTVTGEFSGRA